MRNVIDQIAEWKGQVVVVEGQAPVPVANNQLAYSPAKGKLTEVFVDGFALMEDGDTQPTIYMLVNIRSITPMQDSVTRGGSKILKPGGAN